MEMVAVPNFDALAEHMLERLQIDDGKSRPFQDRDRLALLSRTLREIWNTRGQADLATIESELFLTMSTTATTALVDRFWRVLQVLNS